jgi:hypothetical protein
MGSTNPTANMVMGIASNFSQANSAPDGVMAARTTEFYLMDGWKC